MDRSIHYQPFIQGRVGGVLELSQLAWGKRQGTPWTYIQYGLYTKITLTSQKDPITLGGNKPYIIIVRYYHSDNFIYTNSTCYFGRTHTVLMGVTKILLSTALL